LSERNLNKIVCSSRKLRPFEELVLLEVETRVEGSGYRHTLQESWDFVPTFWHILTKVLKTDSEKSKFS